MGGGGPFDPSPLGRSRVNYGQMDIRKIFTP